MSLDEKSARIMGVVAAVAAAAYLAVVMGLAGSLPLTSVPYVAPLLWTVGAVAALVMAMDQADHFWIANAIYLAFFLSAILGSVAKIVAYRRGFQSW